MSACVRFEACVRLCQNRQRAGFCVRLCQGWLPPTNLAPGNQSALWAKPHTQALRLARPGAECEKGERGSRGAAWVPRSVAGRV